MQFRFLIVHDIGSNTNQLRIDAAYKGEQKSVVLEGEFAKGLPLPVGQLCKELVEAFGESLP